MNKYKQIPQTHNKSHFFTLQSSEGQIGAVGNSIGVETRQVPRILPTVLLYAAVNFFYSAVKIVLVSPRSLQQCWAWGVVNLEMNTYHKGESCML